LFLRFRHRRAYFSWRGAYWFRAAGHKSLSTAPAASTVSSTR
jgi:hypothetical protein